MNACVVVVVVVVVVDAEGCRSLMIPMLRYYCLHSE
jgi:hypothetical protein